MNARRPIVAFVVNGGPESAMAERAAAFAARLTDHYECRTILRTGGKLGATGRMVRALAAARPDVCYVLDVAFGGVTAAGIYRHATGIPFVVDTGDAIVELGRALGRGPASIAATRALEAYALRAAAAVVVRGSFHRDLLDRRGIHAEFIPDGVDVDRFAPPLGATSRPPDAPLVIGVVGSITWVPAGNTCYGWDLIELIRLLRERLPARGVVIGEGSGVEVLKRRCIEYGIDGLVDFTGRVPYAELPARLHGLDICLSTQTNDMVGNVRTTGKLPLYLAAGRFVLASKVGEAARVLPPEMLVDFDGAADAAYPAKLAARVIELAPRREHWHSAEVSVALARSHFDYGVLAGRVGKVLEDCLVRRRRLAG